jgi:hypothetical protein
VPSSLADAVSGGSAAAATAFWSQSLLVATAVAFGAAPALAVPAFVAFCGVALPLRALHFARRRWTFFLLDFCYAANGLALTSILAGPGARRLDAVAAAVADGPLAGALLAWQCAYGPSAEHAVSVGVHALPGLALWARRWFGERGVRAESAPLAHTLAWPLAFYCAWQAVYFVVVHLLCGRWIVANRYGTSYRALARRAARARSVWDRLVRTGPPARRVAVYGGLQLAFTAAWLVAAAVLPLRTSLRASAAWQAAKVAIPLHYGTRHVHVRAPRARLAALVAAGALAPGAG